jgi:hypothetical protein
MEMFPMRDSMQCKIDMDVLISNSCVWMMRAAIQLSYFRVVVVLWPYVWISKSRRT